MGGTGGKRGKGCQGTSIKDTQTKPKGNRIEVRVGMAGLGRNGGWKMETNGDNLNNNKKERGKEKNYIESKKINIITLLGTNREKDR